MPTAITINKVALIENKEIVVCKIQNNSGAFIEVLNYGATLISVAIPNTEGQLQNRILRYKNIESYFTDKYYLGATIGRVANRISGAKFNIGEKSYFLDKNDGENSNHGGLNGLNKKIFDADISQNKVIFSTKSPDGESGFPGNLEVQVSYSFTDENEVVIEYEVKSDVYSPINLTNHAYFNLSNKSGNASNHSLKVYANEHLEFDSKFLPTGKVLPLEDSKSYNFKDFEIIRNKMLLKKESNIQGFNAYFIAESTKKDELKLLAELKDEKSAMLLEVKSTMPGVQFYTGDYLNDELAPFSGVCLEAQHYPDFINQSDFPKSFVDEKKIWKEEIVYAFVKL